MTTPRWYMLNKMGMATLCTSKRDAAKEARAMDMAWPHMGPHRAVQLVEAADVEAMRASHGQAPAQAAPAAVAGPSEFPHEQMDAVALARYKVVPSHESMFHRHAVVAGDGSRQLYIGREVECQNMAGKFAGAFLDGAFAFHSMLADAPTPQPSPASQVDALDAARYRWLRSNATRSGVNIDIGAGVEISETLDEAIDDARATQEGKK